MLKILMFITISIIFNACGRDKIDSRSIDLQSLSTKNQTSNKRYHSSFSGKYDPLYDKQWYLHEKFGIDINDSWSEYLGDGIKIGLVDSGVDITHKDLDGVIDFQNSYRYSDNSHNPTPTNYELNSDNIDEAHGTSVAGLIAAMHNGVGIMGIAPNVDLIALNVFSKPTDSTFKDAILRSDIDISSNSWGSDDKDGLVDDRVVLDAIDKKMIIDPTIFIFSSGNSAKNSDFNSVLNSRYTLVIGASNRYGRVSAYSNYGSNLLALTPGGDFGDMLITTDLSGSYGYDRGDYTNKFEGTSASAAIFSGVVALMLEANKDLSYRDIRYIIAHSSKVIDKIDPSWHKNSKGLFFSNYYGFGLIDAKRAISMAKEFIPLGEEESIVSYLRDGKFLVDNDIDIEYITISVKFEDNIVGKKIKLSLISPQNTHSTLIDKDSKITQSLDDWEFGANDFLDESSEGEWRVEALDLNSGKKLKIEDAKLTIYGHYK